MSRQVGFHDAAEAELNGAASYYDMESPGLGAAFLGDVRHALTCASICNPCGSYWHKKRLGISALPQRRPR